MKTGRRAAFKSITREDFDCNWRPWIPPKQSRTWTCRDIDFDRSQLETFLGAAYISRAGVCADLLEDVLMDHELIISDFIVGEFARKLKEKFHFPDDEIAEVRNSVLAAAQCVEPIDVHEGTCRDPNDLPVLGTAVAGHADVGPAGAGHL